MGKIIPYDHSVIPACDVRSIQELTLLVKETHDIRGIGGYKVGFSLVARFGLPRVVQEIREITDLPVIYDHQKAMTDIPDTGQEFALVAKESRVNAIIGFPQSGPITQETWIKACKDLNLEVIIGGEMTHPKFKRSEGGYIADDSLDEIYILAASLGINNFVVPGNKIDRVLHYKELLEKKIDESLIFYAPGFIAQGGKITDIAKSISEFQWHAIVGRGIYAADDKRAAAKIMVSQITDGLR